MHLFIQYAQQLPNCRASSTFYPSSMPVQLQHSTMSNYDLHILIVSQLHVCSHSPCTTPQLHGFNILTNVQTSKHPHCKATILRLSACADLAKTITPSQPCEMQESCSRYHNFKPTIMYRASKSCKTCTAHPSDISIYPFLVYNRSI
jgi:hypothetical protein